MVAMRVSPGPQLDAARAFERPDHPRRARAAADRVVASERKSRDEEAEARALRVRITDPPGDAERADARWLATQGADFCGGGRRALDGGGARSQAPAHQRRADGAGARPLGRAVSTRRCTRFSFPPLRPEPTSSRI